MKRPAGPRPGRPLPVATSAGALNKYGVIVADHGSSWFISGEENAGWDNARLDGLKRFTGPDFEAVDASGLRQSPDSGAVGPW
ncbi:hypothetical protein [Streptomyces sp. NPDC029003]|uniref:hypothetical protein n=1 Tax=Streptomyces sp. NPDC029003 TaxID=3155125 RepID=UPI00340AA8FB